MTRRTSPTPVSFAVAVLILLILYVAHRMQIPGHTPAFPSARAPMREEWRTYPGSRREQRYESRHPQKQAPQQPYCQSLGVVCGSEYFQPWQEPAEGACSTSLHNGYPVPDPHCTPGGIDPSVTTDVLSNPDWRTRCIRDCETSESEKHVTYRWYGIRAPRRNSGNNQVCELDHLVPLELGGADGLGNIWPECGPDATALQNRYFKVKDRVENYLADEVKAGHMPLQDAQRGIASDWTRYLAAANQYCAARGRC